jgi:pyrimidine-nucleoside phosphorylase
MIGQTEELAPADKKLYALRDVTGTVESPSLICASIMSKKLAEGVDGLVLDVKTGSGAFMKNFQDSEFLAELMVETGERMGKKMVALISDMDQPLGRYIGNALEVVECVEILRGRFAGSEDLVELTLELCGWMFLIGGRTPTKDAGRALALELLQSGKALEKFRELVSAQSGDLRTIDNLDLLPRATHREDILAPASGVVQAIECERMGMAGIILGGGRLTKEDAVDPAVGIVLHKKVGDTVSAAEPLCTVHFNSAARFAEAGPVIVNAFTIGAHKAQPRALIQKVIQGKFDSALFASKG